MELALCGIILRKLSWTLKNSAKNSLAGWHNTSFYINFANQAEIFKESM